MIDRYRRHKNPNSYRRASALSLCFCTRYLKRETVPRLKISLRANANVLLRGADDTSLNISDLIT